MGNLSHTTGNVGIGNALASTIPGVLTVTDTTNTTKAAFGINAANSLNFIQGGGDYMAIGYNLRHTGTNNTWNYAGNGNEFASLLRWQLGGFQFWGTSTQGAAPNAASLTNFLSIKNSGNVGIGTDAPAVKLDVNGGLKVGDFGGDTNVMVKLNNTATAASTPAVGCVIPLCCNELGNTTPLTPGTWFVYLTATENGTDSDEDTAVVMAKIWTVASGTYLRFSPTGVNPSTTSNIGLAYSRDNNTSVSRQGTFTIMNGNDDAYFNASSQHPLATVLSGAGDHKGIVAFASNSAIRLVQGFAVRIA